DSTLASVGRVELRPRMLPLLRRRVVVDEIVLDRPVLHVNVAGDAEDLTALSDSAEQRAAGPAELNIRRLRIMDGTVTYRDTAAGTWISLAGIDETLRLSGSLANGEVSSADAVGEIEIRDIDIDAPGILAWPINDLRIHVTHDVAVDRAADRLTLNQLTLTLQELALDVTGSVTDMMDSEQRAVDLRAQTGDVDVARLVASLPRALRESASGDALTGAAGIAQLDAAVRGPAGAGAIPDISGVLALRDAAIARGRYGTIANGLNGRVAFSLDSIVTDGITGSVLGEPLRVSMRVHDLAAPTGSVELQAALSLAEAQKLGVFPDSVRGTGRVAADVALSGSMVDPAEALVNGSIDLTGVEITAAALQKPVVVRRGRIELDGRNAGAEDLRAAIGGSDLALDF